MKEVKKNAVEAGITTEIIHNREEFRMRIDKFKEKLINSRRKMLMSERMKKF